MYRITDRILNVFLNAFEAMVDGKTWDFPIGKVVGSALFLTDGAFFRERGGLDHTIDGGLKVNLPIPDFP